MSHERVHHLANIIYARLLESPSFGEYQRAFTSATGLPMRMVEADIESWCITDESENRSQFCKLLNLCEEACQACLKVNQDLMRSASVNGPQSCHCFSGLSASAIPVYLGTMVIAYLKTGQVFQQTPTEEGFQKTLDAVNGDLFTEEHINQLRKAYFETKKVEPQRYQSMVTLLEHFGRQLSAMAESLVISATDDEPSSISRARAHIHAHLDEALSLPEIAQVSGMSESHFCRQFKQATGMTLTEYVNYSRILWAKKELLKPNARISEIAFMVGFQSLSQFNRSFAKFQGGSPSHYRDEMVEMTKKAG